MQYGCGGKEGAGNGRAAEYCATNMGGEIIDLTTFTVTSTKLYHLLHAALVGINMSDRG